MYLLCLSFVGALVLVIDATKIGDDHRNRKCYDEDATERTNSAHHLADDCSWNHVSIAAVQSNTQTDRQTDRPTYRIVDIQLSDVPDNWN